MVEATCRVDRFPLIANSQSILFAHAGVSQFTYELPADILYHQKNPQKRVQNYGQIQPNVRKCSMNCTKFIITNTIC
jgi:hypothetical protein